MFGISGFELLIIAAFVLVIFGPEKLPELARTFGRAMRSFKQAQEDMERVIRAEMYTSGSDKPAATSAIADESAAEKAQATRSADAVWAATEEDEEEDEE